MMDISRPAQDKENALDGFEEALPFASLEPGKPLLCEVAGVELAIYRVGDEVFASDDACPHAAGPLSEGDLQGKRITCPYHAWDFCLETGVCLNVDGPALPTYPCVVVEGTVYVKLR